MIVTLDEALTVGRGTERPFSCPNTEAHRNGDANASASLNVDKGVWYCYACGSKGVLDGYVPEAASIEQLLKSIDVPPRMFAEAWLDLFDADHTSSYWASRFGEDIAARYRCGTHPLTGNPTYPLRAPDGHVLGVVQRTDDPDRKYSYPYDVRTSTTLYMSLPQRRADVIVLVEGAADVMALDSGGLPPGWLVAGTYGAGLHYPQVQLIKERSPKLIVAAFDGDKAGWNASQRAVEQCVDIAPTVSHDWATFDVKDPAELPRKERTVALLATLAENKFTQTGDNT